MRRPQTLRVEVLEDRRVPAIFGQPWDDPHHLTLSFVQDGTQIAGHQSDLLAVMSAQPATVDWQRQILSAFQAWAAVANVNLGIVADSNLPFGTPGLTQGDPRFGDVRIGAQAMGANVVAVSVPHDPFLSGTWAGDVFLNSAVTFNKPRTNLRSILLHEFGHVLGLEGNSNPNSVLFPRPRVPRSRLATVDVVAIQALYGLRLPDVNEGTFGNNSLTTATSVAFPEGDDSFDGQTPLVVFGDITTNLDRDFFSVTTPRDYQGPVTFRLQTAGVSLLQGRLTVFDDAGNVVGEAQSNNLFGDSITVHLDQVTANARYFFRVEAATTDDFGFGRYAAAVTFDSTLTTTPEQLDYILRGPYETLPADQIDEFFRDSEHTLFEDDHGQNGSVSTPLGLTTSPGYAANTHFHAIGSLDGGSDANFYQIQTPGKPLGPRVVLTAATHALTANGVVPRIDIFDAAQNPVAADVLLNGNDTFTLQAAGLKPASTYYLRLTVADSDEDLIGNYYLDVDFHQPAGLLTQFIAGSLDSTAPGKGNTLYVAQSQLFQFSLGVDSIGAIPGTAVQMTITDQSNATVFDLSVKVGQLGSGNSVFLVPGQYTIQFTGITPAGPLAAPVNYKLSGTTLSDPIGPAVNDPTLHPQFKCPKRRKYCYPGGVKTLNPYYVGAAVV